MSEERTRRVFVTSEDPNLNYAPALQHGRSIVGVFPPGQVHLHPEIAVAHARNVLRDFNQSDALALAGDPVKILICGAIAAENAGKVRVLRWDRQTTSYVEIVVDFSDFSNPERK